ncbi:MAG: sulfate adenylyltransferase subunit CysD [Gammaproteobacteria bacterium]|nr:sulfate adenylyltransferase subunit CysD [Gammaproteobacteria bacterium]
MPSKSTSIAELNERRHQAVQLRLEGKTLSVVSSQVGLSTPTIVAAMKAYEAGGWDAVNVKPRGRPKRSSTEDNSKQLAELNESLCATAIQDETLWTTATVKEWLKSAHNKTVSEQTVASYLMQWDLMPFNAHRTHRYTQQANIRQWLEGAHTHFSTKARQHSLTVLWIGQRDRGNGTLQLYAHSLRGRCSWSLFRTPITSEQRSQFLQSLHLSYPQGVAIVLLQSAVELQESMGNEMTCLAPAFMEQGIGDSERNLKSSQEDDANPTLQDSPVKGTEPNQLPLSAESNIATRLAANHSTYQPMNRNQVEPLKTMESDLTHLQQLEAESIHIMREVIAEAANPVMLYSMGKDSAVMLHLARKSFYPGNIPFPLLHIDTAWNFKEVYEYRDHVMEASEVELLTHTNEEGSSQGVNPFTHGSELYTDIMKTQALRQALDKYNFDVAFTGARRDEQTARAKERVFSVRSEAHRWDPKNQRPELWSLFNGRKLSGESLRVFPLSSWTELDIWLYIQQQNIPIVPLYLAAERPVVPRDGTLLMVNDERFQLNENESVLTQQIRYRSLGCYPLTGAIESSASTIKDIIQETLLSTSSERQGRMIDHDAPASMEKKKQEGYF